VEWQLFKAAVAHSLLGYADGNDPVWRIMVKSTHWWNLEVKGAIRVYKVAYKA